MCSFNKFYLCRVSRMWVLSLEDLKLGKLSSFRELLHQTVIGEFFLFKPSDLIISCLCITDLFLKCVSYGFSFTVSLKCGQSDGDDIAFQIKPEFSSHSLILNSSQKGSWGKEEKLPSPLTKGSSFDLIIVVNSDNYQVCFEDPLNSFWFCSLFGQIFMYL